MQSLSVCMMVQNREGLLPITLESLGGIYDELIVVDGGSSDRTCEVCSEYGAKIIHSPWSNDYAQQRNVYLKAVQTDWVFAIDSDEFIDKTTLHFLQLLKLQGERFSPGLFFLPRRWISPTSLNHYIVSDPHYPDGQARIFRPQGLQYKGSVHEVPSGTGRESQFLEDLGLYHLDLFVNNEEQRIEKVARYGSKNPQDGAANYYLPEVSQLKLQPWNVEEILPAVQQQLRLLDPGAIAKPIFQIRAISADGFQINEAANSLLHQQSLIVFPNWSTFDESDFFELVEMIGTIAVCMDQSQYLLVWAGDTDHRQIVGIFTSVFTELLLTHEIEVPQNLEILILKQFVAAQIIDATPTTLNLTKLKLSHEDQEATAKLRADRLPTATLDDFLS